MKTPAILFGIMLLLAPALTFAQSSESKSKSQKVYQKKTTRTKVTTDTSDVSAILKDSSNAETGPILNDNGNVNSNGTVDGSRSATGRPDADTLTTYSVKKTRKTVKTPGSTPDTTLRKRRP